MSFILTALKRKSVKPVVKQVNYKRRHRLRQ